jgi:16S rRNA (adenine1518-N6/adenine1519-N6)-dimethyltransferase
VEYLEPQGRLVLEIGPGGGVLTRALLGSGARVLAVELDRAWACHLRRALPEPSLRVVAGDALALAWERLPAGVRVAGNLPYAVGTAIVSSLLRAARGVDRAAFLVQREVADRLVAGPGSKAYGALSVLVAARAEARLLGRLGPGAFRPPPKVESAFVGLALRPPTLAEEEMPELERLVHAAFAHRRKTLRNGLGRRLGNDAAEGLLARAGIPSGARAEEVDLAGFLRLHRALRSAPQARAAGGGAGGGC